MNASREQALNELAELRAVIERMGAFVPASAYNAETGDVFVEPRYALEVLGEIERCMGDWPLALTADELTKGERC